MKCYEIYNDKGEPALSVRGDCIAAYEVRTWEEGHYTLIHLTGGQTINVVGDLDKALEAVLASALGGERGLQFRGWEQLVTRRYEEAETEERLRGRP